ncbi:hypothetical protein N7495_008349 [Penicillium taxi]|uniref:uncharacterized protein n=1 Tax=Penicillium taxi TaxID=168475 RepID=UPI00254596EB|nr:uncharacterized protein N7495_008349 [Penicillium taxi]KAJ5888308.1 hypothetical protein N7495_008349 [Penicillium taxi]
MQFTNSILALGLSVGLAIATPLLGIQTSGTDCYVRLDNFPACSGANSQSFGTAADGFSCTLVGSYLTVPDCEGVEISMTNDGSQTIAYNDDQGNELECAMHDLIVGSSCDATTPSPSSSSAAASAAA